MSGFNQPLSNNTWNKPFGLFVQPLIITSSLHFVGRPLCLHNACSVGLRSLGSGIPHLSRDWKLAGQQPYLFHNFYWVLYQSMLFFLRIRHIAWVIISWRKYHGLFHSWL